MSFSGSRDVARAAFRPRRARGCMGAAALVPAGEGPRRGSPEDAGTREDPHTSRASHSLISLPEASPPAQVLFAEPPAEPACSLLQDALWGSRLLSGTGPHVLTSISSFPFPAEIVLVPSPPFLPGASPLRGPALPPSWPGTPDAAPHSLLTCVEHNPLPERASDKPGLTPALLLAPRPGGAGPSQPCSAARGPRGPIHSASGALPPRGHPAHTQLSPTGSPNGSHGGAFKHRGSSSLVQSCTPGLCGDTPVLPHSSCVRP